MPLMVLTQRVMAPFFLLFWVLVLIAVCLVQAHSLVNESDWLSSHCWARQYYWPLTSPWIGCQAAGAMVREFHGKFGEYDRDDYWHV